MKFTIEVDGPKDKYGNTPFTVLWFGYNPNTNVDGPRAQCFCTDLEKFIRKAEANGDTVEVIAEVEE